ncbi:MAG: cytochrome c-type biogenesis protein CcmH [Pelagibacteraceae bacterium]|nr:cytochrome c-type biogenesis protein CcmH [Pelagibacteraceae bacterium]|tara:strand:+ start:5753 stop:6133 length:381 start_codon:yes stop_codon:yes gene_type:complete
MKIIKYIFHILILIIFLSFNLSANQNLQNNIYKNLRCLVCQGQSIADSNSDFANTIKSVVNDKIDEGMTEKEVYNFLSEKYGDWILFDPPLKRKSFLLWSLPYLFFIIGAFVLLFALKKTLKQRKF